MSDVKLKPGWLADDVERAALRVKEWGGEIEHMPNIRDEFVQQAAELLARGESVRMIMPDGSGYLYEPYTDANGALRLRTTALTKSQSP